MNNCSLNTQPDDNEGEEKAIIPLEVFSASTKATSKHYFITFIVPAHPIPSANTSRLFAFISSAVLDADHSNLLALVKS